MEIRRIGVLQTIKRDSLRYELCAVLFKEHHFRLELENVFQREDLNCDCY